MSYQNPDSEDRLERDIMQVLARLGYETVNAYKETFGAEGTLGRESRQDFVLKKYLRQSLERLNPDMPNTAIIDAIEQLTAARHAKQEVAANEEIYNLLKDGVLVTFQNRDGEDISETVTVIDWNRPEQNHWLAVQQLWGESELYTRRPDVVLFVNGLPLVVMELKSVQRGLRHAYYDNLNDYRDTLPELWWYNAFIVLSNGSDSRIGTISSTWEHFSEWKRVDSEDEAGNTRYTTLLEGTCAPARLLDLVENYTFFSRRKGSPTKILARNHQYLGVENAVDAVRRYRDRDDSQLGVFWHTQGSGKSFSMVFLAQKVFRKVTGNWTFLIITDRKDLDAQIYKNFASSGAVTEPEDNIRAQSGEHLRTLLQEDHRYVFTLIQKFQTQDDEKLYPVLSERDDIIVITDEAHRTQYGTLADNMRRALPNAGFFAFTGTPLIAGEDEKTRETFGEYVSTYDFQRSVEDEATVPLFYENRIPEVELVNERLNEEIYETLDSSQLSEEAEALLERQFSREYEIIVRDDRLESIAEDIVKHYMMRGFVERKNDSKAMVVCIDRFTAVSMYERVQRYWKARIRDLRRDLAGESSPSLQEELQEQIAFMRETDMAVVISQSQNEISDFEARGLNIRSHRKRIKDEDLDTKFKDPDDPFRIVFICAMWTTGFDVPSCATIYLDKPMRNHTLMQTIARANRVYRDKRNGLIVDYIGIFRNLEKALSIYGAADRTDDKPVQSKTKQIAELRKAIDAALAFCEHHGVDVMGIIEAELYDVRTEMIKAADEPLLATDEIQQEFLNHAKQVSQLLDALLPLNTTLIEKEEADRIRQIRQVLVTLARRLEDIQTSADYDIDGATSQINDVLDESVLTARYTIPNEPLTGLYNLSDIDFEALRQRFEQGKKRTSVQKLRHAMKRKLTDMVQKNRTRLDYMERFNEMISRYNAGAASVDEVFSKMLSLVEDIQEEDQRRIKEGLSEEELAIFDLLTRPKKTLSEAERTRIKDTVRQLLTTLKAEALKLDWRKHDATRAEVRECIHNILDVDWLTDDEYFQKAEAVYQHVSESYDSADDNVYDVA